MITVTMKDGTCRQYNTGHSAHAEGLWLQIGAGVPVISNMIAQIRLEDVRMWEWQTPCRVYKPTKPKARR